MRIVVADDDPVMLAFLEMTLQGDGHTVSLATNGDEALDLVSGINAELLVLDVGMPGLDGLEVTRRLRDRAETAALPIVMLTGRDSTDDIIAGWSSGATHYITKPFVPEQLRYFIETLGDERVPSQLWDDSY